MKIIGINYARWLHYLKSTHNEVLTFKADGTSVIKGHADASFALHNSLISHTGGIMTFGEGAIQTFLTKQKLILEAL